MKIWQLYLFLVNIIWESFQVQSELKNRKSLQGQDYFGVNLGISLGLWIILGSVKKTGDHFSVNLGISSGTVHIIALYLVHSHIVYVHVYGLGQ